MDNFEAFDKAVELFGLVQDAYASGADQSVKDDLDRQYEELLREYYLTDSQISDEYFGA